MQKIRIWLRQMLGQCPIVVEHISNPNSGPEWVASIPGTDLRAAGYSYEAALGTLIHNHQSSLGFIVRHKETHEQANTILGSSHRSIHAPGH